MAIPANQENEAPTNPLSGWARVFVETPFSRLFILLGFLILVCGVFSVATLSAAGVQITTNSYPQIVPILAGIVSVAIGLYLYYSERSLPAVLKYNYLGRINNYLGASQNKLLGIMKDRTYNNDQWVHQNTIATDLDMGGAEAYYRLEQLLLLNFLHKRRDRDDKAWEYRLSKDYNDSLKTS